jgi:hypothetical protein
MKELLEIIGAWVLIYLVFNLLLNVAFYFLRDGTWIKNPYLVIKLPPRDKRILTSKEPLYKVIKNPERYDTDGYGVAKYEKAWVSVAGEHSKWDVDAEFKNVIYFLLWAFFPFFILLKQYIYIRTGWIGIPHVTNNSREDDLLMFRKDAGEHFETITKKFWDDHEALILSRKSAKELKAAQVQEKLTELNQDFTNNIVG